MRVRRSRFLYLLLIGLVIALPGPVRAQDAVPPTANELDPESPLDESADFGVAWPDMGEELAAPSATPDALAQPTDERRYRATLTGVGDADLQAVTQQFDALSTLREGEGKSANAAQIDRRAREDADLLVEILRSRGYYDAAVETEVESASEGPIEVRLVAEPGPLYKFESVQVAGLEGAGAKSDELRDAFAVNAQDPVDAARVQGGEASVETLARAEGFPFAKVGDSEVVVDHETRTATLRLNVETGGEQRIGGFTVSGSKPPFGRRHVQRLARIDPGELYDQGKIDDLKRAIIATGLASTVDVKPVPSAEAGRVDIAVAMEPAPPRTIAGEIGYGTGEGARVEASWTHRNLIRPEGAVTFRGVAGTREQYLGAILRQSNFRRRDQVLNARFVASSEDRAAFEADTLEIGAGIERQTNIIWQKKWTWSAGLELIASDERDVTAAAVARRTFFIGALPASLNYDGSDDLLDPKRGFRLGIRGGPEVSLESGTFTYLRAQLDGSAYLPVGERLVVAGRARVATLAGAGNFSIAPSRRLYAGGGGSIRGYGFQMVGPRDANNDPTGGRSLVEFGLEARVRFGNFGVVPFIDGGNVYPGSTPKFSGLRYGAGIGGRYYSNFGPIRIDVATPLNPRRGDSRVTVFVSLGQAF
jgi:translocation and assembly module TamA